MDKKSIIKQVLLIFILLIYLGINIYVVLNIITWILSFSKIVLICLRSHKGTDSTGI